MAWPELTEESVAALSDEQMDDWFAALAAEPDVSPLERMAELRALLETPAARRARLARSDVEAADFIADLECPK